MSRIVIDEKILTGKPVIKGTRISVEFLLELLSSGMSTEDILVEYPQLKRQDVLDAIKYAAGVIKHEELITIKQIKKQRMRV